MSNNANNSSKKLDDLVESVNSLDTKVAIMSNIQERQLKTMDGLSKAFSKLTLFVEKTNNNTNMIDALFKKYDKIENEGVKHCPIMDEKHRTLENRLDNTQKIMLGIGAILLTQVLSFLGFLLTHGFFG